MYIQYLPHFSMPRPAGYSRQRLSTVIVELSVLEQGGALRFVPLPVSRRRTFAQLSPPAITSSGRILHYPMLFQHLQYAANNVCSMGQLLQGSIDVSGGAGAANRSCRDDGVALLPLTQLALVLPAFLAITSASPLVPLVRSTSHHRSSAADLVSIQPVKDKEDPRPRAIARDG
jgi:hypothetical protein